MHLAFGSIIGKWKHHVNEAWLAERCASGCKDRHVLA